jgi:hypothetical protein
MLMRIYDTETRAWLERESIDAREMLERAGGRYAKTDVELPPPPLVVQPPSGPAVNPPFSPEPPRKDHGPAVAAMLKANERRRAEKRTSLTVAAE